MRCQCYTRLNRKCRRQATSNKKFCFQHLACNPESPKRGIPSPNKKNKSPKKSIKEITKCASNLKASKEELFALSEALENKDIKEVERLIGKVEIRQDVRDIRGVNVFEYAQCVETSPEVMLLLVNHYKNEMNKKDYDIAIRYASSSGDIKLLTSLSDDRLMLMSESDHIR